MKKIIRLKESELKRIISESVRRVLREGAYDGDIYSDYNKDPDLSNFRVFKPSEDWEDWNEDNFMNGQDENEDYYDHINSLKTHIVKEVQQAAQSIIEECEKLNRKLDNGEESEMDYFNDITSFFIDEDNCAYAVISPSTSFQMDIKLKTYKGLFGSHYQLDTPAAADENAKHFAVHGFLQYNMNKKENNRLYIGLIKAIINNSLHKEDFIKDDNEVFRYTDLIKNNPTITNVMRDAYRMLVKTHKNLVKRYGGKEIPTRKDAPFDAEFARQWKYL